MLRTFAASVILAALAVLALSPGTAQALPPAGTDDVQVNAQAHVTSRLGQETIYVSGPATIERGDPYMDGGVEVVDMEILSMDLSGSSVTGSVAISQGASTPSIGELRSNQSGQSWPATPSFDLYVQITAPASPNPTITLHNDVPISVETIFQGSPLSITTWPPSGTPWEADIASCVPLLPTNPMDACITSMSFTISGTPSGVGGFSELSGVSATDSGPGWPVALMATLGAFVLGGVAWSAKRVVAR